MFVCVKILIVHSREVCVCERLVWPVFVCVKILIVQSIGVCV